MSKDYDESEETSADVALLNGSAVLLTLHMMFDEQNWRHST